MADADAALLAAVAETLRDAGASFGLVFGSRARGDARPDSDLDVAAGWGGQAPEVWAVELPAGVDLVVLDGVPRSSSPDVSRSKANCSSTTPPPPAGPLGRRHPKDLAGRTGALRPRAPRVPGGRSPWSMRAGWRDCCATWSPAPTGSDFDGFAAQVSAWLLRSDG